MKLLTVVGARPQCIKAAAFSRVVRHRHTEILVHTGQHYDTQMSDVFFDELGLPKPDHHLGVGSGSHGWQTHVIEFFAIGTAVRPLAEEIAPDKIPDPIMVLSVND